MTEDCLEDPRITALSGCRTVSVNSKNEKQVLLCGWCRVARFTSSVVSEELNDSNFRVVPKLVTVYQHLSWTISKMEAASFSSPSVDCKRRNTGTYTSSVVVNSNRGYIKRLQDGTVKHARLQASAAVYLNSSLFCDVTRRGENR